MNPFIGDLSTIAVMSCHHCDVKLFSSPLSEKSVSRLSYMRAISREVLDEVIIVLNLHREKMEAMNEHESEQIKIAPIDQEEIEKVVKRLVRTSLTGEE